MKNKISQLSPNKPPTPPILLPKNPMNFASKYIVMVHYMLVNRLCSITYTTGYFLYLDFMHFFLLFLAPAFLPFSLSSFIKYKECALCTNVRTWDPAPTAPGSIPTASRVMPLSLAGPHSTQHRVSRAAKIDIRVDFTRPLHCTDKGINQKWDIPQTTKLFFLQRCVPCHYLSLSTHGATGAGSHARSADSP